MLNAPDFGNWWTITQLKAGIQEIALPIHIIECQLKLGKDPMAIAKLESLTLLMEAKVPKKFTDIATIMPVNCALDRSSVHFFIGINQRRKGIHPYFSKGDVHQIIGKLSAPHRQ